MSAEFRLDGEVEFRKSLEGFFRAAEQDASRYVQALALRITYNLVMETPQYSGAAASAWRVGIGSPEFETEKPDYKVSGFGPAAPGDVEPYSKQNRNMEAVNKALALCSYEIGMFGVMHQALYISNGLDYTQWFEKGEHAPGKALRQVNLPQRTVHDTVLSSLQASSVLRY